MNFIIALASIWSAYKLTEICDTMKKKGANIE